MQLDKNSLSFREISMFNFSKIRLDGVSDIYNSTSKKYKVEKNPSKALFLALNVL